MDIFSLIFEYRHAYLSGLAGTLKICLFAWLSGITIGCILSFFSEIFKKYFDNILITINKIIEAIPILVILFWLHYPFQSSLGIVINPLSTTMLLLAILNILKVFVILKEAMRNIPRETIEIASVMNVNKWKIFLGIKLPLSIRNCIGQLTSQQVNILQLSIFGGLISADEIFRTSQRINAEVYQPVEVYSGLAIFFLIVCFPLNLLAEKLKSKYALENEN